MTGMKQMPDRAFIDTNVIVYMSSNDNQAKKKLARSLINKYDCVISTQVINELSNVLIKKYSQSTSNVEATIFNLEAVCTVALLTLETTNKALDIHDRYGYSFYDALILSAALDNNCKYVFSEDLQDGQILEGKLTIINPFS